MSTGTVEDRALRQYLEALGLKKALGWVDCLITDRDANEYVATRLFADTVRQVNANNSSRVIATELPMRVYVYAHEACDVQRRPRQSARVFILPVGTEVKRETIDGKRFITARNAKGGQTLVMVVPNGTGTVRLIRHSGFIPPSGRAAGARSGRRSGPSMDKSANS